MTDSRTGKKRVAAAVTAMAVAVACLGFAQAASAATSCTQAKLNSLRSAAISARAGWKASPSDSTHSSLVATRNSLVQFAESCQGGALGSVRDMLAGATEAPTRSGPSSGPHTLIDGVDAISKVFPTTVSGPAGTTLSADIFIENQGTEDASDEFDGGGTVQLLVIVYDEGSNNSNVSLNINDDPNRDDSCGGLGETPQGARAGFLCTLNTTLATSGPDGRWAPNITLSSPNPGRFQIETNVNTAETDALKSNDRSSGTMSVTALGGVSISKVKLGAATAVAGSPIQYQLTVSNAGPSTAEGVVAKDFLPAEVTLTGFSTNGGTCTAGGGFSPLTCTLGDIGSGSSRTITVSGTVAGNVDNGTIIFNDATVTSSTADENTDDNSASVGTTVTAGQSGLTLDKTGPSGVTAGDSLTYTISVQNIGVTTAHNVVIRDSLPSEISLTAVSSTKGACNSGGFGGPSCTIGTLSPLQSETMTVTGKVAINTPDGTVLFNSAQATSDAVESDTADNVDEVGTEVDGATAGVAVTKNGPAFAVAGTPIEYTIVVQDVGTDPVTNVVVRDTLPLTAMTLTSVSSTQGACSPSSTGLTCTIGNLTPSGSATITVDGIIKSAVPDGTVIFNSATGTTGSFDSDTSDNTALLQTTISAVADLSIDATDSSDPVNLETPFRWIDTVTNAGPSDAVNVVVTDTIPKLMFDLKLRVLPSNCDRFELVVKCSLGTLKAGATAVINLELEAGVSNGFTVTHTASVSSTTTDPDLTFNTDSETTNLTAPDITGSFTSITSDCSFLLKSCIVSGKFNVTNAGNKKSVSTTLRFVNSDNTTLGPGDPQLKKFTINQLKPGVSQEVSFSFVIPINQYLIAQVDSDDKALELDEKNNVFYKGPFPKP